MEPLTPVIFGAWIIGTALFLYYTNRQRRVLRALRDAPLLSIRDVSARGHGRIAGAIAFADDRCLIAPLSRRRCVFYRLTIHEAYDVLDAFDDGAYDPELLASEQAALPFLVRDDTGEAHVDPSGGTLLVVADQVRAMAFDAPDAEQQALLDRHGVPDAKRRSGPLRFAEGVLAPGERVTVLGACYTKPAPDLPQEVGAYRKLPPSRVYLRHSERAPLLISDKPDVLP